MIAFNAVFGSGARRLAGVVAGLLVWAPSAFAAAVTQFLEVRFETIQAAVPLSDWLTAGTALLLAAAAAATLRARRGRFLGVLLAVATSAVLLSTTGQRIISEARAGLDPQVINLVASPGTLEVSQYALEVMGTLQVVVTNTTGAVARILSISLTQSAPFLFDTPPGPNACLEGQQLAPGAACIVYLELPAGT